MWMFELINISLKIISKTEWMFDFGHLKRFCKNDVCENISEKYGSRIIITQDAWWCMILNMYYIENIFT